MKIQFKSGEVMEQSEAIGFDVSGHGIDCGMIVAVLENTGWIRVQTATFDGKKGGWKDRGWYPSYEMTIEYME